jgi:NAD(P)-dependent dehydrogenase (short-subunit alcohol dehydrogenase family)
MTGQAMKDFKGKTAIVTGAASGIGLGIARAFAQAGMNVALADIEEDALARARGEIEQLGAKAITIVTDVSDRASVLQAAETVEREFGKLHVAVNNAGVSMHNQKLAAIAPKDWEWLIGVNLMGAIHGIQAFLPLLTKHGEAAHLVNTASIAGFQVNPDMHSAGYAMTKYGVVALSEGLHNELKDTKVGVSVLCPAAVDTLIYRSARNRPDRFGGATERTNELFLKDLLATGWAPDRIGARVLDAIRAKELFIFTHSQTREWVEQRHDRLMDAFDRAEAWEKAHSA